VPTPLAVASKLGTSNRRREHPSWLAVARGCSRRFGRSGRHDQDRAAGDADDSVRDAAEERGLESTASARANDDQLGVNFVRYVSKTLGRHTGASATLSVEAGFGNDLLEQARSVLLLRLDFLHNGRATCHAPERGGGGVWDVRRLGDVSDDQLQLKPIRQAPGHAKRRLRIG
jgi:hypothetical protein